MEENMAENEFFKNKYIDDIDALYQKHGNFFAPVLDEFADFLPSVGALNVLDVGCGKGIFTAYLKNKVSCLLYGIDASDYALKKAKNNGFDFLSNVGDLSACRLPFEDNFFDAVIVKDVFEHLLYPLNLLVEIRRITKPGGHILVHCPNHFTLFRRLKFVFNGDIDTFGYFPGAKTWEYPHIRFFSSESLKEFITTNGFEIVSDLGCFFPDPPPVLSRFPGGKALIKRLCQKNPSLFVEGLTLVATKINDVVPEKGIKT